MLELTNKELEDLITSLDKELFVLERNGVINGIVDSRMISVRSALEKFKDELNNRSK